MYVYIEMFIPKLTRFQKNKENECYEKRIIIDSIVYVVSIPIDRWKYNTQKQVSRWIKQHPKLDGRFPFGTLTKQGGISETDVEAHRCEYCSKILSCFRSKVRHMNKCTFKEKECTNLVIINPSSEGVLTNERTVINNNNTTNNIVNNNGITVNIQINSFGKENPKWLTERTIGYIFQDNAKGLASLIKAKHFNDDFPENQNIRIDTKNNINKYVQVHQNGKWRLRQTKPTLDSLLLSSQDLVTDILDTEHDDEEIEYNEDDPQSVSEQHIHKTIRDFQNTEYFRDRRPRLVQKWVNVHDILADQGEEYKKIIMSIKTAMLDRNLVESQ